MNSSEDESLWEIFSRIATKYPDNVAVEEEVNSCTYADLRSKVTLLATELQATCTGTTPFLVLFLPPGISYVVASLATLSLNKIVVVVHDTYTGAQVEKCLELLHFPTVVTTLEKWNRLGLTDYNGTLHFIGEKNFLGKQTQEIVPVDPNLRDVAYCMFTSGSTGTPKAVLITNRAVVNGIDFLVRTDPTTFTDKVRGLMGIPLSFVPSLCEVWTVLGSGGTLVVPPADLKLDMDSYRQWITTKRITAATFATPVMELLLSKDVHTLTTLRWVAFGGARFNPQRMRMSDAKFNAFNIYGATELFIASSCRIPAGSGEVTMSVGKPITGMKVYVVDEFGRAITESRVSGDLYVAGTGLMRGYYGQPELTAQVLTENRFDTDSSPMYATGDIGYMSSDGQLFVSGRKDEQIKVHGMRLELGEIESLLCTYPGIHQSVVVAMSSPTSVTTQLVAFCTVEPGRVEPSAGDMQAFLSHRLQRHAIPSSIRFVDDFPRTPSGKVNRLALKGSLVIPNVFTFDFTVEVSDWLKSVRQSWATVLNLPANQIRAGDNFFYLGGSSLMAFAVMEDLRRREPSLKTVSPLSLFQAPVLSTFAQALIDQSPTNERQETDFEQEITLSPDFPRRSTDHSVLITGTTGFLGKLILLESLKDPGIVQIYTIVRARTDAEAMSRLDKVLGLNRSFLNKRVTCFKGDLTQSNFGLRADHYAELVSKVKVIFHSAADVSFVKTYDQLKETTVTMTKNLVRFALEGSNKQFHLMSSIGVFDGIDEPGGTYVATEARLPPSTRPVNMLNAYFQSKWVSEQLVWTAYDNHGLDITIHRIGQLGACTETGFVNRSDALAGFVVMCQKLGVYPNVAMRLPYVDGDVGKVIWNLAKNNVGPDACACECGGANVCVCARVFHLIGHEVRIGDFFEPVLPPVPLDQWEAQFEKVATGLTTEDEINAWIFLQMLKTAQKDVLENRKNLMKNISFSVVQTDRILGTDWKRVNPRRYVEKLS